MKNSFCSISQTIKQVWDEVKLPDTLSWIIWAFAAIMILSGLNISLVNMLVLLAVDDNAPSAIFRFSPLVELLRAFCSGFIFFTFFYRFDAEHIIPNAAIRGNAKNTFLLLWALIYLGIVRVFIITTAQHLMGMPSDIALSKNLLYGLISVVFGGIYLASWLRRYRMNRAVKINDGLAYLMNKNRLEIDGIQKIQTRLTESQRKELGLLLFQSQRLNRVTVVNVALILGAGFGLALMVEILVGLIQAF